MHPMLNIAVRAVRKAGDLIAKYYYEIPKNIKNNEKDKNNFVINANKVSEIVIIETIRKFHPKHIILSKETVQYTIFDQDTHWIINPLDGIVNFAKHLPYFSVSIAVKIKNRTEIAVVYDPIRNELFTATRGQGAQLNGYRLHENNTRNLNNVILSIGFPFKKKNISNYINILSKLSTECADFRRIGSSSLDLAYVAASRIDGYFEVGLKQWNYIAAELIVREAGKLIYGFTIGHNYSMISNIIAGTPRVAKAILAKINDELNAI